MSRVSMVDILKVGILKSLHSVNEKEVHRAILEKMTKINFLKFPFVPFNYNQTHWLRDVYHGKVKWVKALIALVMTLAITTTTQGNTNDNEEPMTNLSTVSFEISEHQAPNVAFSGPSLWMFDTDQDKINYALFSESSHIAWYLKATNTSPHPTSPYSLQYAEISYKPNLNVINYENTPTLGNGRRGYELQLTGCDLSHHGDECPKIDIILYITDEPEIDTMSGSASITSSGDSTTRVGDTLTASFSNLSDSEGGVESLQGSNNYYSVRWSQEACPTSKGLGQWTLSSGLSWGTSYNLGAADEGHTISVWGKYRTTAGHSKWVCEDIGPIAGVPPAPTNRYAPAIFYSPSFFSIVEGSASRVLVDPNLKMWDRDVDWITYNLSGLGHQMFKVRNQSQSAWSWQLAEIEYLGGLDFETAVIETNSLAPEYILELTGCDSHQPPKCSDPIEIIIRVQNKIELNLVSGSVSISGSTQVGNTLTADFSRISDPEGDLDNDTHLQWYRGACPSFNGAGTTHSLIGSEIGSGDDLSYELMFSDQGHKISIIKSYVTFSGQSKWVCGDTETISANSSWPTVYISAQESSTVEGEPFEITLNRSGGTDTASPLQVRLIRTNAKGNSKFYQTIPAGQDMLTFDVHAISEETNLVVELLPGPNYKRDSNASLYMVNIDVTPANENSAGKIEIDGVTQVGETLTANLQQLQDPNGLGSFSYQWWKIDPNEIINSQRVGSSTTYLLKAEDFGFQFKLVVTYRDGDGFQESVSSSLTDPVEVVPGTSPYVVSIYLESPLEEFLPLGSTVEASVGDSLNVNVRMSAQVRGLSEQHKRPLLKLEIGGQTRILRRSHNISRPNDPNLNFFYVIQTGDNGGSIIFPNNGISVVNKLENEITPPNNTDFSYPRTPLGSLTILPSLQRQEVVEEANNANANANLIMLILIILTLTLVRLQRVSQIYHRSMMVGSLYFNSILANQLGIAFRKSETMPYKSRMVMY